MAVIATVGAADANSFGTQDEADDYLELRPNPGTWTDATEAEQTSALVEAGRYLNLLPWQGYRVTSTQAMAWPRYPVANPDIVYGFADTFFANDEIPLRIKHAQFELAYEILAAGTTNLFAVDSRVGVKRKKVDVLETEYFEPSQRVQGVARFTRVHQLIGPLLDPTGVGHQVVRS